ncbi:lipoyl synthase [Thermocladium modestius]|nr:lipoyl synthase [Thermocladium modestius]
MAEERLPAWIRVTMPARSRHDEVRRVLGKYRLNTVCEDAKCPNAFECWGLGTATIMILGDTCTRACRFCAVKTGKPGAVDWFEPIRVALAVRDLGLKYVVITSVDRDDLADGGASIYASTVRQIKRVNPGTRVEALIPDFNLNRDSLRAVVEAGPDVVAHNLETVERLTPLVRDRRGGYGKSLEALRIVKELRGGQVTKSSIMLGLGEERGEVIKAMRDLRDAGVDILTIGQYLRPTGGARHLPVARYVPPNEFQELKELGLRMGFRAVAAGPLVRSSYRALELFDS